MSKRFMTMALIVALLALAACQLLPGLGGRVTPEPEPPTATPDDGEKGDGGLETTAAGFTWRREGGIAGFCDEVTATVGDVAMVATCRTDPPDALGSVELTAGQAGQLGELVGRLASFRHEQSDPATADAMTIAILFTGGGDAQPTDEDIAAIEALAMEILRAVGEQ